MNKHTHRHTHTQTHTHIHTHTHTHTKSEGEILKKSERQRMGERKGKWAKQERKGERLN